MDQFCGSQYWNWNVTWNSQVPDFTYCFHETALIWTPCLFFWITMPYEWYRIKKSKIESNKWTAINLPKFSLSAILVVISFIEMIFGTIKWSDTSSPVYFITPLVKLLTFINSSSLIWFLKVKGIVTSPILFLFWLLISLISIFNYRMIWLNISSDQDSHIYSKNFIKTTLLPIYIFIFLCQFILSCFADVHSTKEDDAKECPEKNASFLSKLTFWWSNSLIILGYKKPLNKDDMWRLSKENSTEENVRKFQIILNAEKKRDKTGQTDKKKLENSTKINGILIPLIKTYKGSLILMAILKLIHSLIGFAHPIILNLLITFMSSDEPLWRGYVYAVMMLLAMILESIVSNQYDVGIMTLGMRIRSTTVNTIYRKSLNLSSSARKEYTLGEIVNLMSIDTNRMMEFVTMFNDMWSSPIQVSIAIYLLWNQLGYATIAGVAVMLLLLPINALGASRLRMIQVRVMKFKDKRIKLMNEILNGVKVLKLYAWEKSFNGQVAGIRGNEIKNLKTRAYFQGMINFAFQCSPILVAIASFTTFVLIDKNNFNANVAFVSLTLLNQIRWPLSIFPRLIVFTVLFAVSLRRINKYLAGEEIDTEAISHDVQLKEAISVKNVTFSWEKKQQPSIKNISFKVKPKQLVAIVGQVGSGKSSLLYSLLGNLHKHKGEVNINGSLAYVPQQAWIMNTTLKNNVIFTNPVDQEKFDMIMECCQMRTDLDILPGRELTEIGEKGINLSGGQKQRVSMARACYSDADVYLLDDPLSALDAHVGKQIFERVISSNGILKDKTRVLVTHRISVLPRCDNIIVMKNGQISECGSYKELLKSQGDFAEFLLTHLTENDNDDDIDEEMFNEITSNVKPNLTRQLSKSLSETSEEALRRRTHSSISTNSQKSSKSNQEKEPEKRLVKNTGKLTEAERSETGKVKWRVYFEYLRRINICGTLTVISSLIIMSAFNIGSSLWLTRWSDDVNDQNVANDTSFRNFRLGVYAALGIGEAISLLTMVVTLSISTLLGSKILHEDMLDNMMRAPMSYFDTTPMGRILNVFSRDIDVCDTMLQMNTRMFMIQFVRTFISFFIIGFEAPSMFIAIVPMMIIYYFVQGYYIPTSRQLKRIESTTRAPIYIHFSETLAGTTSIRAYGSVDKFIEESNKRVDVNNSCYYPSLVAGRWLSTRLEFMAYVIVFLTGLYAVVLRTKLSPGSAGLILSYAMTVTKSLGIMVREATNLETNIVSVERCLKYTQISQEAEWHKDCLLGEEWPQKGVIKFENYSTRYREGLDLVLKQISFQVNAGERVGVVGRTGAGKSSLTLALFRVVEPVSGTIYIDDVDICSLGLYDLRSRLTIIPQDPVLFTGTLRLNLDPLNKYTDEEIWISLELAHLKDFVSSLESGLNYEVSEGGENLSVGQKQLVCLARALLKNSKVIILDEATAAVDIETDELIQKTIREQFANCTILTIAHRLNTVIDYDRILVMDRGQVAEYDSPDKLLGDCESLFYGMAKDAGLI